MIHLLQRPPFRLLDPPIRPDGADQAPHREKHIGAVIRMLHQRRRNEADKKIHQPVSGGPHRDALVAEGRGEDFSGIGPGDGTPCGAEGEHVEEEKGGGEPALGLVRGPVGRVDADEGGDDGVGEEHGEGAEEEEGFAAEGVHCYQGGGDADELGYVEDAGEDELHAVVETHGFE